MSILNPSMNKMIADLAGMPPQQLAQYAAQNKDDTMKFLAAKAASDMQKKQMAMGAAQQQPQAAPPVADQVIQQMAQGLPEESGIAQLPAPNMQGMAGGGIVAFSGEDESLVRGNTRGAVYNYGAPGAPNQGLFPDRTGYEGMSLSEFLPAIGSDIYTGAINAHDAIGDIVGRKRWEEFTRSRNERQTQSGPRPRPRSPQTTVPPAVPGIPYTGTGIASPSAAALRSGASTQASQAARANAALRVNTGAGVTPPSSAGAMSIAELQRLQASLAPTGTVADPYATENAEKAKLREDQAKLELADSETRKAGLAGLLAPKEARIKAREDRLQKSDDMNLNMSLINAGLAMMQSRGQGLAGIAEGANVGVKQYSEGLKMSEAARQKIEDAKDAFEELKFNQTNMSQKEITANKRTIAEGAIASKNETIAGIKEATGAKTKAAEAIFSSYVQSRDSAADRASRERTAAFSAQVQREIAAMPGANERLYSTLGGGDVKKGFDYLNAATAEGKGDEAIMQAVIKSPEILGAINPALRKVIEQRIADRFAPQVQNKAGDRP